jgi:uncharacterized protein (TIGR00270 family)
MTDLICEICGDRDATAIVQIEGAKLAACPGCSRGGKLLYRLDGGERGEPTMMTRRSAPIEREEIVDDYGPKVAKAIKKMGLPLEVIAEKINEKESYIRSIEQGRMSPTLVVARKLEKELGVRLVEMVTEEVTTMDDKKPASFKPQTLEDILDFQKKSKKK